MKDILDNIENNDECFPIDGCNINDSSQNRDSRALDSCTENKVQMIDFNLYTANCCGDRSNCIYPEKTHITDKASFLNAIKHDHVCAAYTNNYRSNDNFLAADVIPMDCDNDHSDDQKDWVYPIDVMMAFPNVQFLVSYSRNHMKVKNGKAARPKFHVYFPIPTMADGKAYAKLKKRIQESFQYFDINALGEARFLFGTDSTNVEIYAGSITVADLFAHDEFVDHGTSSEEIVEGRRNSTMSRIAGKLVVRYGATDEAHAIFLQDAEKCNPPLDDSELETIWNSAINFGAKVSKQDGYIAPEVYNFNCRLKPEDFSDVGQAKVLAREYREKICFSPATDYMVYNGSYWEEALPKAQGISQELTERQLIEATAEIEKAEAEMKKNGAKDILSRMGPKKASEALNPQQALAVKMYNKALAYKNYAIARRDSREIASALKEAKPMLYVEEKLLDANEFLLNCPSGTIDLRKGVCGLRHHDSKDYITKQTAVDPSDDGADIWLDALKTFFENDTEVIEYVQKTVGLAAVGKVFVEALIIAYGEGRNGKSTFWNVISRVLGTYSGNISADMLTVGCRRNIKPELAEAKGKRLLIAAELEEGMRLNTANVKQLCSTDEIYAEKKYKAPFSYVPSHMLVLYTNHLPKVGAVDKGTWRRLIVIPFNAKIEGNADIKNYADFLFEKAGGAILTWVIDGAKKVIADNFHVTVPQKVKEAIDTYRENNDWMKAFLDECCESEEDSIIKSSELYQEYRRFCCQVGEYTRNNTDFFTALESLGYEKYRKKEGRFIKGLRLKNESEQDILL